MFYARAVASGSIRRKDGGWCFRVDVGRDVATGRRRQVLRQGFRTKKEAERALQETLQAFGRGMVPVRSRLALGVYLRDWLSTQDTRLRPTTKQSYSVAVRHISSHLGRVSLQDLTPLDVERFYAELSRPHANGKPGLSAKSIRNVHVVLRKALADAERLGQVTRNAASVAKAPVAQRPEHATWTSDDLREFLNAACEDRLFAAFVLLATTGMRRGEVAGLRWVDIDLDGGRLAVVQTLTTVGYTVIVSPPKTARSRRFVYLDPHTVAVLREHRRVQRAERLAAGSAWDTSHDLAFCDVLGGPLHPDQLTRVFVRRTERAGLPRIRLHDVRHTYATLALKAGVHPKVVSERLGHATVGITLDLYSHVTPAIARDAADVVADAIFATPLQTRGRFGSEPS
jgi:integrase